MSATASGRLELAVPTLSRLSPFTRAATQVSQVRDKRWQPAVPRGSYLDRSWRQQILCHRTEWRLRRNQRGQFGARSFDLHRNLRVGGFEIGNHPQAFDHAEVAQSRVIQLRSL